jgi:alpha/beta superfamily hydrolase
MRQKDPRLLRSDVVVEVAGPVGVLKCVVTEPAEFAEPRWLAVIGHPHPQMGGTLHNKVVATLARAVRQLGGLAVRFNYRGVEGSEGAYDEGVGEVADFLAVYRWSVERYQPARTCVAGFSFGSYIAASAQSQLTASELRPAGLLLVAPPVARMPFNELPTLSPPSFVIQGEVDDVVEPESAYNWVACRGDIPAEHLIRVPGADHFFHGRLSTIKDEAVEVFSKFLSEARQSTPRDEATRGQS